MLRAASRRPGPPPGQERVGAPGQPAAQVPVSGLERGTGPGLNPQAGQPEVGGNLNWRRREVGTPVLEKQGAPILPQGLQLEQELQLWNEIDDACSSFLSMDPLPQASNALEELCFIIMGTLPKPQETDEKDNTKRFLFHYSKTQKLANSNAVSSVLHPLLQLVPQLHERRMKRFKVDEEFHGPIIDQSRGFFLFRPRNGRRSEGYI
nr:neuromedin-U [Delphinus delphis]